MKSTKYHIDVTPEEDALFRDSQSKTTKFFTKKTFIITFSIVLGLHLLVAAAVTASNFTTNSTDTSFISNNSCVDQQANEPAPSPTPLPTPEPTPAPTPPALVPVTPNNIAQTPTTKTIPSKNTTHYTIKKGDTLYSISKRYKLNLDKLIKINNIKNPNALQVGQTIKFL